MIKNVDFKLNFDLMPSRGISTDLALDELSKNYLCMICKQIVLFPKKCKNCNMKMCKKCIKDLENEKCLECNQITYELELTDDETNELKKFKLKCLNKECEITTNIIDYYNHIEKCDFSEVVCNYCNNEEFTFKNFSDHLNKCVEYKIQCRYCKSMWKRKEIETHEKSHVDSNSLICPFCFIIVNKRLLNSHLNMCDKADTDLCDECFQPKYKDHICPVNSNELEILQKELKESEEKLVQIEEKNKQLSKENIENSKYKDLYYASKCNLFI